MVTPTNGTVLFRSIDGRQTKSVNVYLADVVGHDVTFSYKGLAVAASQNFTTAPFDCYIADISLKSGPTVVFTLIPNAADSPTGDVLQISNLLESLTSRILPTIGFQRGQKITFTEQ